MPPTCSSFCATPPAIRSLISRDQASSRNLLSESFGTYTCVATSSGFALCSSTFLVFCSLFHRYSFVLIRKKKPFSRARIKGRPFNFMNANAAASPPTPNIKGAASKSGKAPPQKVTCARASCDINKLLKRERTEYFVLYLDKLRHLKLHT